MVVNMWDADKLNRADTQGCGKTTTCMKYAHYLKKKVRMACPDVGWCLSASVYTPHNLLADSC